MTNGPKHTGDMLNASREARRAVARGEYVLSLIEQEARKGCELHISPHVLSSIVPPFTPFDPRDGIPRENLTRTPIEQSEPEWVELRIFAGASTAEQFLLQGMGLLSTLSSLDGPYMIELHASSVDVALLLVVRKEQSKLAETLLHSVLGACEIERVTDSFALQYADLTEQAHGVHALVPKAPYYRPAFCTLSEDKSILSALLDHTKTEKAPWRLCYRLIIERAREPWELNCMACFDYEQNVASHFKTLRPLHDWSANPSMESPSAIKEKLHPERQPLFFALPMLIIEGPAYLRASVLSAFKSFQFGTEAYGTLDTKDFRNSLENEGLKDLVTKRRFHVYGHLLNRFELSRFIPLPCTNAAAYYSARGVLSFRQEVPDSFLHGEVQVGTTVDRKSLSVYLHDVEKTGMVCIGRPGYGKSTLILHVLQSIGKKQNQSIVLFYFHEMEFVLRFIASLPKERQKDVIFATPMRKGRFLRRNLVSHQNEEEASTIASFCVEAIERCTRTFGVDVHIKFQSLLETLILNDHASFDNLFSLLNPEDPYGRFLRNTAMRRSSNRLLHEYMREFETKSKSAGTIHNKLAKFYSNANLQKVFSYTGEDAFSYDDIVSNGKILIWYFGGLGEAGNVYASYELSKLNHEFQKHADDDVLQSRPCFLVVDEAQRLHAKDLDRSVKENRKFGFSPLFASQALSGIDEGLLASMRLIPTMGAFQTTEEDAKYVASFCGKNVSPSDVMKLPKYQMIVRSLEANNVFHVNTLPFPERDLSDAKRVIDDSLERYYLSAEELLELKTLHERESLLGGRPKEKSKPSRDRMKGFLDEFQQS